MRMVGQENTKQHKLSWRPVIRRRCQVACTTLTGEHNQPHVTKIQNTFQVQIQIQGKYKYKAYSSTKYKSKVHPDTKYISSAGTNTRLMSTKYKIHLKCKYKYMANSNTKYKYKSNDHPERRTSLLSPTLLPKYKIYFKCKYKYKSNTNTKNQMFTLTGEHYLPHINNIITKILTSLNILYRC